MNIYTKNVSKVVEATSEWLTEEAKQTRETFRVEAARVAGDRTLGKDFERLKRVALVSCVDAIFIIKSTKKDVIISIRSRSLFFSFCKGYFKWSVL